MSLVWNLHSLTASEEVNIVLKTKECALSEQHRICYISLMIKAGCQAELILLKYTVESLPLDRLLSDAVIITDHTSGISSVFTSLKSSNNIFCLMNNSVKLQLTPSRYKQLCGCCG